ncbi:sensor histidine kinase [Amycolatopsis taiwanensis]|uniref:sensor histidine kinase n=1 Tax=Amycolatopsis taiwanensis TaxID=342230 RepID=UPI001FDF7598|nr:sensor histidine kinase [Amycolatopsis taiwanensis]
MPADVPVDGRQVDAWQRWFWLWRLLFAVDYVFASLAVLTEDQSLALRLTSFGALTALAIVVAIVLPRPLGNRAALSFSAAVLVLITVAIFTDPSASFALFSVCPAVAMKVRQPVAWVVMALSILPSPMAVLIRSGFDDELLTMLLPMTALLIIFGICVSIWIDRVIVQSTERAQLIEQLDASRAELARLSHEAGISAERERLAREIHDTLAQGFTSIVALLQAIESELDTDLPSVRRHVGLATRTARENLAEARAMVAVLPPSALTGSLADALRRQAEHLAEETGIEVDCRVPDSLPPLPTATEVVLLRAAQEAIANVRKHANASHVSMEVTVADDVARLVITDDGAGFDPDRPARGYGLAGMRDRARQVGGAMTVRTGPGTTVTVEVPL